jgi:ketosteroid isomerase-like protein
VSDAEDLVRRLLDAHNRGADAILGEFDELAAPDFTFTSLTVGAMGAHEGATYHGREGMRRYYEERAEAFGGGEVLVRSCETIGEAVVVSARSTARGRGSGVMLEEELTLVYWVRDGKVVRGRVFRSREDALEVVGA